jgi:hypothetical protein
VLTQHLVSSLSAGDRSVRRLRESSHIKIFCVKLVFTKVM